eukprot:scaffold1621_cov350-Prasinococcus_capsulatus_cf.AAC.7
MVVVVVLRPRRAHVRVAGGGVRARSTAGAPGGRDRLPVARALLEQVASRGPAERRSRPYHSSILRGHAGGHAHGGHPPDPHCGREPRQRAAGVLLWRLVSRGGAAVVQGGGRARAGAGEAPQGLAHALPQNGQLQMCNYISRQRRTRLAHERQHGSTVGI